MQIFHFSQVLTCFHQTLVFLKWLVFLKHPTGLLWSRKQHYPQLPAVPFGDAAPANDVAKGGWRNEIVFGD